MHIQHIHIQNFRGIKEINLPLPATEKKQWIFLTGENGYGKTVFLQALALGLVGGKEHSHYNFYIDESENPSFEIKYLSDLPEKEARKRILGYGYARLNKGRTEEMEDWVRSRIYSLFRDNAIMQDIEDKLLNKYVQILLFERYPNTNEQSRYETTKTSYYNLLNKLQNVFPKPVNISYENEGLRYHLLDTKNLLPFKHLSVGYKGIITLIGDIILKLEQNFNAEAIIFIDEFDAHLHPKWQREFVKKLSDAFPNVQFVVATHSPIPLLGVSKEKSIILNVEHSQVEGITVRRLDEIIDFENMLPNAILSSPIFGMYDLTNPNRDEKELLLNPNDYSESVFEKILENKLKQKAEENGFNWAELKKR